MKRYIMAMSIERTAAKRQLTAYSPILIEHIIKLLVYSDIRPNDVHGWERTLANWIHRGDGITLKPKNTKVTENFLDSTLFSFLGDTVYDFEGELYAFIADNRSGKFNYKDKTSYPEFEVTPELAQTLMDVCYAIRDSVYPLLIDKQDHTIDEYEAIIQKIFDSLETC